MRGQEALPESQERLGGPGEVRRLSWRAGRGWEALPEDWEGSGGYPGGLGKVGSPSQMARRGRELSGSPFEGP